MRKKNVCYLYWLDIVLNLYFIVEIKKLRFKEFCVISLGSEFRILKKFKKIDFRSDVLN